MPRAKEQSWCSECGEPVRSNAVDGMHKACREGGNGHAQKRGPQPKLPPPSKPDAIVPVGAAVPNGALGTLVVSEAQMARMFNGLPLEAKVAALQAYLDGQQ